MCVCVCVCVYTYIYIHAYIPITDRSLLCAVNGSRPKPLRLPTTREDTRPENPAATCTTLPPEKSRMPSLWRKPNLVHMECAMGQYTTRCQKAMNTSMGPRRMRSAKEPHIKAGVRMANAS